MNAPAPLPRAVTAACLAFCAWMFLHPLGIASGDPYRDNDWFTDRVFDVLARDALLQHGQLPLRSHLLGGGYPTLGHPFDGAFSPTLLPTLLLGDVLGVKVVLALLLLLGTWGVWGLAREELGMGETGAAFAALAFAWAGWLPSMLLVGFYPQCFYLLTPAILRLLWRGDRRGVLLGGTLFFLPLTQAGNGALAIGWAVAIASLLRAAAKARALPLALVMLFVACTPPAFAAATGSTWPLLGWAGLGLLLSPAGRRWIRELRPVLGRGVALVLVAAALASFKLVAVEDLLDRATYQHELSFGYELWFPTLPHGEPDGRLIRWPPRFDAEHPPPPYRDPDFYADAGELLDGLVGRAPSEGEYEPFPEPGGGPMEERPLGQAVREYLWVGLSWPILALALLGLGVDRRRAAVPAAVGLLVAGICLGPHLVPDLHFLLIRGLPGFDRIVQPLKYFNFFFVPCAALLGGLAVHAASTRAPRLAMGALALLLWPFAQNGPALAERFHDPVDAGPSGSFSQVAHIGHPDWAGWAPDEIERAGRAWMLRELARPEGAREYVNARRGVGVVDWYGTLTLPEAAIPARYITPTGRWIDNPRYPGAEAWLSGDGAVSDVEIGPTRLSATVRTGGPRRLFFNQNHDPDFVAQGGRLAEEQGLLAVDVDGDAQVVLRYEPRRAWAGLALSALAVLGWIVLWRRSRPESRPRSSSVHPTAEIDLEDPAR